MGDFRPASLFISYSHKDKRIVYPLVDMNEDLQRAAWVDYLHTTPGSDWNEEHKSAIKRSYRLILLWSVNSAQSKTVEKEWRWALKCGTQIVPVLLDETPLPPEVSHLHGVSLKDYVVTRRGGLSLGRFPPSEWMGLGSAFDVLVLIMSAPLFFASGWLFLEGISHDWIIVNILAWICLPFFAWYALNAVLQIPFLIKRGRLRHRLSRIVVENLKEWARENRVAQQKDG
ncbi:MAG: toll/interleukin-1 receptor domain-containing protein [Gammaproteobacteria bacterium]|nr:toll/interleukin-1 receptor domain-containing protein [Gammaproteobacteria bacterium]